HYRGQLERLGDADPQLAQSIEEFRADELQHRAVALENGAGEALGYELIAAVVKTGSRFAIWLSERL
ncbi:MAG: demethoxyubiquinone hydroxylase family protein, partial [Stellaceae bacterium]